MTINANYVPIRYTATSGQTIFPYTWKIFESADLKVYKTPAGETPSESADILPSSAYTVSINADPNTGGNVTLNTGASTGDLITIVRDVTIDRETDYSTGGDFTAISFNTVLDKSRAIEQQLQSLVINQGLTYADTTNLSLPSGADHNTIPKLGPSQIWKMSAAGTAIEAAECEEGTGCSTLRSELENNSSGTDGAKIVGYHNATTAANNTLKKALDEIYSLIASINLSKFRTGDVKGSIHTTAETGWILLDDGTIGNASSGATTRANADTQDLFELLWSVTTDQWCPVSGGRGASGSADFAANKTIRLPQVRGRVLASSGQPVMNAVFTTDYATNNELFETTANELFNFENGQKVRFTTTGTLPTGISTGTDYYITKISGTTYKVSTTPNNMNLGTYVTLSSNGTGTHTMVSQFSNFTHLTFAGQEKHLLKTDELAPHVHKVPGTFDVLAAGTSTDVLYNTGTIDSDNGIAEGIASTPFDIVQPSVFFNYFIKL